LIIQVDIAEDFEELLIDKMPDVPQQLVRLKHSLLENAFTEFVSITVVFSLGNHYLR